MLVQHQTQMEAKLPLLPPETASEVMSARAGYASKAMQLLAHQLRLSPREQIPHQLLGIQKLLTLINDSRHYPYELVCFHLTGYQNKHGELSENISGQILRKDLLRLAKELSVRERFLPAELPCSYILAEDLRRELKVSPRTLHRWTPMGLIPLRIVVDGAVAKSGYLGTMVARFKADFPQVIERATGFSRVSDEERTKIIRRARELMRAEPMSVRHLCLRLTKELQRSFTTIQTVVLQFQKENPNDPFSRGGIASGSKEGMEIFTAAKAGEGLSALALRFGRSEDEIKEIILRERCFEAKRRTRAFFDEPLFKAPEAEEVIVLAPEPPALPEVKKSSVPPDVDPYIQDLFRVPLLGAELERFLFRKYNYLKFRHAGLLEKLDPETAGETEIRAVERSEREINRLWQRLMTANLRLVVSVAKQHLRRGVEFHDLVSEGNMVLAKAVDLFDHRRGFKFSSYLTWALRREFMMFIVDHEKALSRYRSGEDEVLAYAEERPPRSEEPSNDLREILAPKLAQLSDREREIIRAHYGLGEIPATFEEIGERLGVTKERIRQIEKRARKKLLKLFDSRPMPAF